MTDLKFWKQHDAETGEPNCVVIARKLKELLDLEGERLREERRLLAEAGT